MYLTNKGRLHACLGLSGRFVKETNGSYKITIIMNHNYIVNPCNPVISELYSFIAFNTVGPHEKRPYYTFTPKGGKKREKEKNMTA